MYTSNRAYPLPLLRSRALLRPRPCVRSSSRLIEQRRQSRFFELNQSIHVESVDRLQSEGDAFYPLNHMGYALLFGDLGLV
jgi:hypothetical protein